MTQVFLRQHMSHTVRKHEQGGGETRKIMMTLICRLKKIAFYEFVIKCSRDVFKT